MISNPTPEMFAFLQGLGGWWTAPVDTEEDLPLNAKDADMVFILKENRIYMFYGDIWYRFPELFVRCSACGK